MKKRKIISGVLAMSCLLGASGGNAFAVGLSDSSTNGSTLIRKIVPSTYSVTIPDNLTIPDSSETKGVNIPITAGSINIKQNERVDVKLCYSGAGAGFWDAESSSAIVAIRENPGKNLNSQRFVPVRLTDAENGGNIAGAQKEGDKIKNGDKVASFDANKNNLINKRLYIYRMHEKDKDGNLTEADCKAGCYSGFVSFSISCSENN